MKENAEIFIVEDEAIILESYRAVLTDSGYRVVGCAYSGKQALDRIPRSGADLLLMDINLPDMSGLDVLEKLREEHNVPCVFITGYYDDDLVKRANSLGAFGYVMKPIREEQLLAAVRIALERAGEFSHLRQEVRDTKQALEDRKLVERAKGILMRRQGIGEEEAMRLLQKKSADGNKKLARTAAEIIRADSILGG